MPSAFSANPERGIATKEEGGATQQSPARFKRDKARVLSLELMVYA